MSSGRALEIRIASRTLKVFIAIAKERQKFLEDEIDIAELWITYGINLSEEDIAGFVDRKKTARHSLNLINQALDEANQRLTTWKNQLRIYSQS